MRRGYIIPMLGLLLLATIGAWAAGSKFDYSHPDPKLVNPVWPDPRVRWEVHDVSRFILKQPGGNTQMVLPDGTFIQIPVPLKDTVDV